VTAPAPPPPLATLAELETRAQRALLGTPDESRATAALADASALVRAELPPALLAPTVPPVVVAIVCQAAGRSLRNPDGFASEQIGQYGYRYGEAAVTGVYLSTDERAVLRRLARRSGLRSTRTPYSAGDHPPPVQTAPVVYADGRPGEPMPWWFPTSTDVDQADAVPAGEEVRPAAPTASTDGHHPG
jgi:phage gp36-like protein